MPRRRPAILTVAAAVLFITGGGWMLYGPVLPLLPPIVPSPVPPVATAFGMLGIAGAIGVIGVRPWSRPLGVAVVLADLTRTIVVLPGQLLVAADHGILDVLGAVALSSLMPASVAAFTVFALVARWPEVTSSETGALPAGAVSPPEGGPS